MIVNKCPECGGEVQATVELYLSHVGIDRDRLRGPYPAGDRPPWLAEFTVYADGVGGVEYDQIRLYCENDHNLDHLLDPGAVVANG